MIIKAKPFFISFLIHLVLLISFLYIGRLSVIKPVEAKPVVIDFSIEKPTEKKIDLPLPDIPKPQKQKTYAQPERVSSIVNQTPDSSVSPDTLQVAIDTMLPDKSPVEPSAENESESKDSPVEKSNEQMVSSYIKEQFTYIRKIIASNIIYPQRAQYRRQEGTLLLSFVIMPDGSVSNIKVIKSSGFGLLDKNAVSTIEKSVPFPRPPFMAELKMPVTYRLF